MSPPSEANDAKRRPGGAGAPTNHPSAPDPAAVVQLPGPAVAITEGMTPAELRDFALVCKAFLQAARTSPAYTKLGCLQHSYFGGQMACLFRLPQLEPELCAAPLRRTPPDGAA